MVSSGQRRRVRLFLGLLKPFKVALIDEMTMDLDIITRVKFMNWLKKESIENKSCIIYATHIFDGLNDWGTHVAHMKPNGILSGANVIDSDIIDIAYKYLSDDYEYLKKNNISENEDGEGYKEYNRNKNKTNGPQGGYGSGRLTKFF
jgi:CCR4-NOT complex subunit CAF16